MILIHRCAAIAAVLLTAPPASAGADGIPAFARRYSVSCILCHNPAPALTAFGGVRRYETLSGGAGYLVRRNFRVYSEGT